MPLSWARTRRYGRLRSDRFREQALHEKERYGARDRLGGQRASQLVRRAMIERLEFTRAWALPEADLARFLQLSRWA